MFIMNIYRNIDRSAIQFDFLLLNANLQKIEFEKEIKEMGGNIYIGEWPNYKKMYRFLNTTKRILKKGGYDCIHSHVNIANSWVILAAKLAGVTNRISHSHDTYGKDGKGVFKVIHNIETLILQKYATAWLACSKEAGAYLYGEDYFRENGRIINNGIEVGTFANNDKDRIDTLRKELNLLPDDFVVGNITRFEAKKNQLFLIDVFAELLHMHSNSVLILGGVDGGQLTECKRKVNELGLVDKVRFIGPRNDVPIVLHIINCYVFPSLYEGLGIVLLEAQAAGCYCMASDACPKDSDMGVGLIDYLPLEKGAHYWAKSLMEKEPPSKLVNYSNIEKAFDDRGYSIKQLVYNMSSIYMK